MVLQNEVEGFYHTVTTLWQLRWMFLIKMSKDAAVCALRLHCLFCAVYKALIKRITNGTIAVLTRNKQSKSNPTARNERFGLKVF